MTTPAKGPGPEAVPVRCAAPDCDENAIGELLGADLCRSHLHEEVTSLDYEVELAETEEAPALQPQPASPLPWAPLPWKPGIWMGLRQVETPSGQPVCVFQGWVRPDNALEDMEYIVHACNNYPAAQARVAELEYTLENVWSHLGYPDKSDRRGSADTAVSDLQAHHGRLKARVAELERANRELNAAQARIAELERVIAEELWTEPK